jgi:hypothetical protein
MHNIFWGTKLSKIISKVKNLENPPGLRFTQKFKSSNYGAFNLLQAHGSTLAIPTPTLNLLLSTTSRLNFSFLNKLLGHKLSCNTKNMISEIFVSSLSLRKRNGYHYSLRRNGKGSKYLAKSLGMTLQAWNTAEQQA